MPNTAENFNPPPEIRDFDFDAAVAAHESQPEVDYVLHSLKSRLELGEKACHYRRIYLDLRWWIAFRDALAGQPHDNRDLQIIEMLRTLVKDNKVICPLAFPVYDEVMRIGDPDRATRSAELIDQLSRGFTLLPPFDLLANELTYFLCSIDSAEDEPHPLISLAWTKPGHVVGEARLVFPGIDKSNNLAIQKAMFDCLNTCSFRSIIASMSKSDWPSDTVAKPAMEKSAASLSQEATRCRHEINSFAEALAVEHDGGIDACAYQVYQSLVRFWAIKRWGTPPPRRSIPGWAIVRLTRWQIDQLFRRGDLGSHLPGFQVSAGLHALIRWENRRYNSNDLVDIHHAQSALPYCDVFLTERKLANLLNHDRLRLGERFDCFVVSDRSEILDVLSDLD